MKVSQYFVVVSTLIVCIRVCALIANDGNVMFTSRDEEKNGTFDENLTWRISGATLFISGSGRMSNLSSHSSPWGYDYSVESVVVEEGVTSIGTNAFRTCPNIINISIPKSVDSIFDLAFYSCNCLTKVIIPENVKYIGNDVFSACSGLQFIEVEDGNKNYRSKDGVLFSHDLTHLIQYPAGSAAQTYSIPNTVTSLGNRSFYSSTLISVSIPESVQVIGDDCFQSCPSLKTITIPNSVTLIGRSAFQYCQNLTNVVIGENVLSIEDYTFYKCPFEYISIPGSVKWIGDLAFNSCNKLKAITFGNGLKTIRQSAFGSCSSLKSVIFPDSVETIEKLAFSHCTALERAVFGDGLISIGLQAFEFCNLTSVNLPDSVISLDGYVFRENERLTNVTIGINVESIGYQAFACRNLKTVYFKGSFSNSSSVFHRYASFDNVCVPSDYNSSSFGGVNITSNTTTCQIFQSMFNNCYLPTEVDGTLTQVKRKNVTEFEARTNGCVDFQCNNDTDPSVTVLCNELTPFCVAGECKDSAFVDGFKVRVELDMEDGVSIVLINEKEIKDTLHDLFGLGADEVAVGCEVNDDGSIPRVMLYLKDMDIANAICDAANGDKTNSTGFLRLVKRARLVGQELFLSGESKNQMMLPLLGVLFVLLFELFC